MTSIEWTDVTWNPTDGCKVCSPGCSNCYAMRFAGRFAKPGERYHGLVSIGKNKRSIWTGEARLDAGKLAKPLRWRKPRRVFVNSMSDLFYEGFSNEQIAAVFGVMAAAPQHTFQVLTKRAKRMREWFGWLGDAIEEGAVEWAGRECGVTIDHAMRDCLLEYLDETACDALSGHYGCCHLGLTTNTARCWPLPNVWLGTSTENQEAADERIPDLLATPAALRFLSIEPMIGAVDLCKWFRDDGQFGSGQTRPRATHQGAATPGQEATAQGAVSAAGNVTEPHLGPNGHRAESPSSRLSWVIAGCESGPGSRVCKVEWLRFIRDQCAAAGVPFFLKQIVADEVGHGCEMSSDGKMVPLPVTVGPESKRKAGNIIGSPQLDGRVHLDFPIPRTS